MKNFFFLAAISLFALTASADSWRIYRHDASYVGGKFAETNRLPAGTFVNRVVLCTLSKGDPFLIAPDGSTKVLPESSKFDLDAIQGAASNTKGATWFFTPSGVCRYDEAANQWHGYNAKALGREIRDVAQTSNGTL